MKKTFFAIAMLLAFLSFEVSAGLGRQMTLEQFRKLPKNEQNEKVDELNKEDLKKVFEEYLINSSAFDNKVFEKICTRAYRIGESGKIIMICNQIIFGKKN